MDPLLRKCFTASGILGLVVLILVFVAPAPPPEPVSVTEVPERLARLILEKPRPIAPAIKLPAPVTVETPKVETPPRTEAPPPPRRRTSPPKVAKDRGVKGRQIAQQEVTQNLAEVTGSLDKVLDNLSKSLPASADPKGEATPRRRRSVRTGRRSDQLASVQGTSNLSAPDVSRSAIQGEGISIAAITDLAVSGGGMGDIPTGGGAGEGATGGRNDYRSNEALLSVVRRYAPGIQFCYDNELKRNPGLRGKLVISLTVEASGRVSDASVVDDSLHSPAVTSCVLAQVRGWQFPTIPHGTTTFKTPFVFTPPE